MAIAPGTLVSTAENPPALGPSTTWRLLRFRLGNHTFAIVVDGVHEIVRAVAVSPLPGGPAIVEGVLNYRGTIVPVLDIRSRFNLPGSSLAAHQHMLVAQAGRRMVALRVDEALDLVEVSPDSVDPAPQCLEGIEHLKGVARLPDGLVVIQDLDRFLSLDEAMRLDRALVDAVPPPPPPLTRGGGA